jgi:chromosome segregation ATPase
LQLTSSLSVSIQSAESIPSRTLNKSTSFDLPLTEIDDNEDPRDLSEWDTLDEVIHTLSGESDAIYDNISSFIQNITAMKYKQEKLFSHTFKTLRFTQNSLSTLQMQNSSLRQEVAELTDTSSQLQSALAASEEKNNFQLKRIAEMDEICEKLSAEKENLVSVLESLNSSVSEEKSKELQLELTIQQRDKELLQMVTEKMAIEDTLRKTDADLQTSLSGNQNLQNEVIRLMSSLQTKEKDAMEASQKNKELSELLEKQTEEWSQEKVHSESVKEELRVQVVALQLSITELEERQQRSQEESKLKDQHHEAEVQELVQLRQQVLLLESRDQQSQSQLQEMRQKFEELERESETKTQAAIATAVATQASTSASQFAQLTTESNKLKTLIAEYQSRMKLGGEELKRLKAESHALEEKKLADEAALRREIMELKQKNSEVSEIFTQLTVKYNELITSQSIQAQRLIDDEKLQQILQTKATMESEIDQLKAEIQQKKSENQEMLRIVSEKANEMEELTHRNSDLKGNIEKLKKEYETVTHEEDQLTKELIDAKLGLALAAGEVDVEHNNVSKLKRVLSTGVGSKAAAGQVCYPHFSPDLS